MRVRAVVLCVVVAAGALDVRGGAAAFPNDDKTILHALNRIAYGPRPGDVERVRALGLQKYIEQQLHPDRIPDPSMAARLAGLTTLTLSSREIAERFEIPQLQARRDRKQEAARSAEQDGQAKMPDP